ncbi:uncharacterized protein xmas [Linepithema humile]|uniref:uncharacterized protein xmas n=1 Tax=Linepithema humile TaxID=83485 RepID=UPI000623B771|nr:PREDICTED: uncharacterized protein LOC105679385 [Linepithema humile]
MDKIDAMELDASKISTVSNSFVFSKPSVIFDSSKVINFGLGSDHVFGTPSNKKDVFTFATPTIVSENDSDYANSQMKKFIKRKSRTVYKPTVNVFANALKDAGAFEQLKKNSRSQPTKIDINNSITCSNVPKTLLTKTAAKEYFTKYGNIVKITIRPHKRIIIVVYTSKMEANNAYYNIGNYMGETFHIEWTGSSVKSPIKKKNLQKNIVANLLTSNDDEIKAELEAMSNLEYNLHSSKKVEPSDAAALFSIKTKTSVGKTAIIPKLEKVVKTAEKAAKVAEKPMKVEKLDVESQIAKLLPTISVEELQNIIHQIALTAEDKYKVLEARDRLMRLKRVKPASLATAKVTNGTCPDMCPEKERLMRESQRQVASYEQLDGNEYRINHAMAVKQYSRSSADQEEPMPHELRPVKSLKMTMSYLLHEIMDFCEQEGTNLAEWYHFLWDRTRGIRKDITQQELCCVDSVELVEQCARFHIVCSERLCAEDASVFDKKINSENLTKCLQTLKYMYQDLRVKGITCENEPEFRAYVVLLNLNNGNFLYDLQQLPKSVQNSPEVQFAIKVYFSLDSNNYYKFFKLVRETTYLNACILLRYFNQVRLKALSIMIKAYCRSVSTAFPLYELIDILGFEDENEAKYFCEQVGLNLSDDELYVLLNRLNFSMPAASIQQNRACNLIESKRIILNYGIGQCIAGRKMPEKTYKNHKPHNSFDAHGNLMPESINAADQSGDVSSVEQYDPYEFTGKDASKKIPKLTSIRENQRIVKDLASVKKQSSSSESNIFKPVSFSGSNVSIVSKTLISDSGTFVEQKVQSALENKVLSSSSAQVRAAADKQSGDENVNKQQPAVFGNINFANPFASNPTVFSKQPETSHNAESTAPPFAMTVTKSIFSGTKSANIFVKNATPVSSTLFGNTCFSAPASAQIQPASADIANKMTREQKDAISEAEKARLNKLEHARRMQQLDEQSEEIYNSLHAEVTRELCSAVAREDIDRIKMYDTLSKRILGDMVDEVTREMCDAVLATEIENQRKLQAMLLKIKNRVILKCFNIWKQYVSKRKHQRKALEDTPVWLQRQSVEECARMLYSKQQKIVVQNMRMKPSEPEDATSNSTSPEKSIEVIVYAGIRENLRLLDINPSPNIFWKLVISWPDLSNRTMLWHHKKTMNQYLYPDNFTMDPIVKVYRPNSYEILHVCIRHFEGLISDRNLVGTDALLFIADAAEDHKSVAKRLMRAVLSRHKLMPIPLAFIILNDGNLENQNESVVSVLESLLESGYVSEYTVMHEKNLSAKVILNLTKSAVLWLTMNRSPPNPLEMDHLHNVYDICLSEELWLRILGDAMFNKQLSSALINPNFVIDLHNEAVNHLMDIISDPESMLYTSFAPELKRFLKSNRTMPCSYEYLDESWKRDEYRAKLETAMNSFTLPSWNAPWPIEDIQDLRRHIMHYCRKVLPDSNCNIVFCDILSNLFMTSGSLQVSSFVQILLHIIKEKVRLLDDQTVIYNRNHVKHFRTLPWWFKSDVLTEFISHELNADNSVCILNEPARKRKKLDDRSVTDLDDDALDEEFDSLAKFCEDTRTQVMEVHSASQEIENRLQTQQLENTLLEEKLKNALFEEVNLIEKGA